MLILAFCSGSIFYFGYLIAQYPAGYVLQRLPIGKVLGITTISRHSIATILLLSRPFQTNHLSFCQQYGALY